jgi:hypothetical protein
MSPINFFPDASVYKKFQSQHWQFDIETWKKDGEERFALKYKSPRMNRFEITDLPHLFEPSLRDEESWTVARRFMDDNLMFQAELKQKMLDLFRANSKINPDDVEVKLEFKIKSKN